ncbi:Altered inheritance of mitochondria protein 32 [Mycena sanguinolenta]|uniref:Altered inheritance of mitochondria protein 32 n=1 Tax=Mycena sanguinolenta TaxID=230812 RepID=A0A8H6ZHL0_9AGAR|nr:Altered inheritance of mitochondria protein 32 [Mycena sanguinolenta]
MSAGMLSKVRHRLSAVFSTTSSETKPLQGSVASHRSYILLNSPSPPSEFPSRFSTTLQRALQVQTTRWGGLVNFAWTGSPKGSDDSSTSVTAFSALGGAIHFPNLSLSNVDEIAEKLRQHATASPMTFVEVPEVHIYVCTHGARDCRCGDMGGKVFQALRDELDRRILADPNGPAKGVVLGEVGHVGGHVFAANALIFPHGEWLGLLTPKDVPSVLDTILSSERRPFTSFDPPLRREFWRGRMGLSKDEQLNLYASHS